MLSHVFPDGGPPPKKYSLCGAHTYTSTCRDKGDRKARKRWASTVLGGEASYGMKKKNASQATQGRGKRMKVSIQWIGIKQIRKSHKYMCKNLKTSVVVESSWYLLNSWGHPGEDLGGKEIAGGSQRPLPHHLFMQLGNHWDRVWALFHTFWHTFSDVFINAPGVTLSSICHRYF